MPKSSPMLTLRHSTSSKLLHELSSELHDARGRLSFDYNVPDSAFYLFEHETSITIARPLNMNDIKDHPSYWFLKEIEDFREASPFSTHRGPSLRRKAF